ncbi:MAG: sulfatase-like hydrolase/transferase [Vicinamibacterales bacterium]
MARTANALFFVLTATYCILTYSSFAYQQFIRPRVVASIAGFAVFHPQWHWLFAAVTAMTLAREARAARGRVVAWSYLAAMAVVGVLVSTRPVLPTVENDIRGFWLACAFLVPPIWLAVYDHLALSARFSPMLVDARRIMTTAFATAVAVWTLNLLCLPFRSGELGEFSTSAVGIVFGAVTSLAVHLAVFAALGGVIAGMLAVARRASRDARLQYAVLVACGVVIAACAVRGLVFKPLAFSGIRSWALALELGVVLAATWSAVAMRLHAASGDALDAFDTWTLPVLGTRRAVSAAIGLLVLACAVLFAMRSVEKVDWNFLVQNLCVVIAWLVTCAFVYRLVSVRTMVRVVRPSAMSAGIGLLIASGIGVAGGTHAVAATSTGDAVHAFVPEFVLDAYATLDPSYRLIRQALTMETKEEREFFAFLRANSLIQHVDVQPIDVDVVHPLGPAPEPPPHIFLFAIDSLRRDYVSAYNPKVTFTPALARFAAEELAFTRAFTRYGGTGLSMPAIWAGSMLLHKEYVLPFARMNALEKLLLANGYRFAFAKGDPITEQLVSPELPLELIDQGKADGEIEFCATMQELESKLSAGWADRGPLMVHTRPMNLHVSKLTQRSVSTDPAFGEFHPAAAAAVQRIDGCFGRFIDFLKDKRLYDNSIVIFTSDHGDSLGEANRWGHSSTIFPEIVRVPLLIHVPARMRERFTADLDAASYSTDLTPSIYALLGYTPEAHDWPQGRSLFVEPGVDTTWRKTEPAFIASSYGPVYGVLRDNGQVLYIADGVNSRDYAYDLSALKPVRIGVTAAMRQDDRSLIHEKLAMLASLYHFTPKP